MRVQPFVDSTHPTQWTAPSIVRVRVRVRVKDLLPCRGIEFVGAGADGLGDLPIG